MSKLQHAFNSVNCDDFFVFLHSIHVNLILVDEPG